MIEIYADESCKDDHHYFVLGCTLISKVHMPEVLQRVGAIRSETRMTRELKWNKVSRGKLMEYTRFVDEYFRLIREGKVSFHCLIADAWEFDHNRFNEGCSEIGYNKLLYQLLVKAARRFTEHSRFHVYLDDRTTRHSLEKFREILNSGYRKETSRDLSPFTRVVFRDSKACDIIQLNDLIIGAVGFHKNGHHTRENCSQAKCALAARVTELAGVKSLCCNTRFEASDFRIWNFALQPRRR